MLLPLAPISAQASKQGGKDRFDTQDAIPERNRYASRPLQRSDLRLDEPTLRTDGERDRLRERARARLRRMRMRHERPRTARQFRQFVLHETPEEAPDVEDRQHRVLRL